jgi:PucR C-terminal helix-turn-helix domain/GGDEF-like domain
MERRTPANPFAGVRARLEGRLPEIERAILTRIHTVSDPAGLQDVEYVEGLRAAVSAALSYGLAGIEHGEERSGPMPAAILAQAREAAHKGVSLDTVLRRYFAGYTLLGDFVMQEAEDGHVLGGAALHRVLRTQAALLDRLLRAVTDEYTRARETEGQVHSFERRRVERVKRLLAGELIDVAELAYDLDAWHIGVLAGGRDAEGTIREVAKQLDRRLLVVCPDEGSAWAWLGGRRKVGSDQIAAIASSRQAGDVCLAIGEPGEGIAGWRLTHQQAMAAGLIARRSAQSLVRYADVALLASMFQDDLLATSLRELYLVPLAEERDGGAALRQTLRAYFAAGRQASSAAAELGVSRQTVGSRLRTVEEKLGRSLDTCAAEIEAALRLEDLNDQATPPEPLGKLEESRQ